MVFGSPQIEIGPGKGRVEEDVGKIVEPLLSWERLRGGGQAQFLRDKFLEVVVQRDAPRMRLRNQAFFHFGF